MKMVIARYIMKFDSIANNETMYNSIMEHGVDHADQVMFTLVEMLARHNAQKQFYSTKSIEIPNGISEDDLMELKQETYNACVVKRPSIPMYYIHDQFIYFKEDLVDNYKRVFNQAIIDCLSI
jgi:hypothetical protein